MLTHMNPSESFARFLEQLDRYAAHLQRAGKYVRRESRSRGLELFQSLSDEKALQLTTRLETASIILEDMQRAGETLTDSPRFLWRFLAQGGFTPCSDIFGEISDGDVIEIFGLDQTHLFVNLNYYDYVSVTLERLFLEPWYMFTRRDEAISRILHKLVEPLVRGDILQTFAPDVPAHLVEEVDSEMMLKFTLRIKCVSPIFAERMAGFVCINECRLHTT